MTRPGCVMVEFPIEEAEIMLTALQTPDGSMWIDQDSVFVSGCERLERAVRVEREPGGNAQTEPVDVAA